jgi:chaperonin GroES
MKSEITKLLEDRIAVRPDAPETKTEGGMIIPNPQGKGRGTVVTCGPGKHIPWDTLNTITDKQKSQRMTVKVGDVVIYGRFTGGEIIIDGESLLLMRECDIVAVVKETIVEKADEKINRGSAPRIPNFISPSPPVNKDNGDSAVCNCGCANSPNCRCKKPTEIVPNKTSYDACCGADCDCTSAAGDEGETDNIRNEAGKAGFCVRCRSFGCDCTPVAKTDENKSPNLFDEDTP